MQSSSGAYIISRKQNKRVRRGKQPNRNRGAALLILILLLLTAAICLLVVFLPQFSGGAIRSSANAFGGKDFYMLSTARSDDYQTAAMHAQDAANRGGAGFVYNDGTYHAIAGAYAREADAKALADVNEGAYYFALSFPKLSCGTGDKSVLEYLCGEFFTALYKAASDLDRGAVTEAAADRAVRNAFSELYSRSLSADTAMLGAAVESACDYSLANKESRSVASYIRFVTVRAIVAVYENIAR